MTAVDRGHAEAWVRTSLELSVTALEGLVDLACRGAAPAVVPVVRDLADHIGIWAEELALQGDHRPGHSGTACPEGPTFEAAGGRTLGDMDAEAAAYIGRIAGGLLARFCAADARLPAPVRRAALACTADFDAHLTRADALLRRHERSGNGSRLQQIRGRLPSRREFLRANRAALATPPPR